MTGSVRVTLRVAPGATRSSVVGRYDQGWKVRVAAAPEGGKANDAVVRLLAKAMELPASRIAIVAGHTSRTKIVEIEGLDAGAVEVALARAAGGA